MSRRTKSATDRESTGDSCERLHRRRSSCDCRFAYDNNCLATARPDAELELSEVQPTTADSEAIDDGFAEYELAAIQASCWLRQMLCLATFANDANEEDGETGADEDGMEEAESQAQLQLLFDQFDSLSVGCQSKTPRCLQPSGLRQLRARQLAVCHCLAEANRLHRQGQARVSAERAAILERLRGCRERLELVAKCAARLGRNRRRQSARRQSSRRRQPIDDEVDGEGDLAIDRDRRLVRDSAARARRNIDELAAEASTAAVKATLGRRGRRLLVECTDCLRCRADRLERQARDDVDKVDIELKVEGQVDDDEAKHEQLMARVESRLQALAAGSEGLRSLQPRWLRRTLDELELAQFLLNSAKDCCSDECCNFNHDGSFSGHQPLDIGDADDDDSITSIEVEPSSVGQTLSAWLHRQQRLAELDVQLTAYRQVLTQLLSLTRSRLVLRRDLQLRTLRLRHLAELAESAIGKLKRFDPKDFLNPDELEAIRPTTPELLTAFGAKMESLSGRINDLAVRLAGNVESLLLSGESSDRRYLKMAERAMLALQSQSK